MQYKTRAFVIRRRNLKEADRLVILLTEKRGKVKSVARGARRSSSRLAGHLEPFCFSALQIAEGRGLAVIAGARIIRSFPSIRADIQKTHLAFYFCEILDRFLPEDEKQEAVFLLTWQVFNFLEKKGFCDYLVSFFIFNLLSALGYLPHLNECAVCGKKLVAEEELFWSNSRGGAICGEHYTSEESFGHLGGGGNEVFRIEADRVKIIRLLVNHNIRILDSLPKNKILAQNVLRVSRSFLHYQLGGEPKSARGLDF